jgi:hypothetical protein
MNLCGGSAFNSVKVLDFGDGLFGVHSVSLIQQKRRAVKRKRSPRCRGRCAKASGQSAEPIPRWWFS